MNFIHHLYVLYITYFLLSLHFSSICSYGKPVSPFVYVFIYYVGVGKTTLTSVSDGSGPYFSRQKLEKKPFMKEEVVGEVFFSRQSRQFHFIDIMIKVLFPICTLNWRVSDYVSRQVKSINKKNESTINIK